MLHQLILGYRGEGVPMPYTVKDFKRDYIVEHFPELTEEERLRLLRKLSAEERLKGLPPEEIESYLEKLRTERPASKRKPRRKR